MSQLTVQLSDRADALIAQLQKEIFQRRRKKVSAAGVIETLVESGAKSQSDKRFATSWKNLVADIEKAARLADAHGARPAGLSDEEWVLVLSHRTRSAAPPAPRKARAATARTTAGRKAKAAARRPVAEASPETVAPARANTPVKAKPKAGSGPSPRSSSRRSVSRQPRAEAPVLKPAPGSASANGSTQAAIVSL
ncbi:hypothetical protein NZK32_02600 [Cyanobium sp. FGCU-52]|nr:hypothetical protein [Cyanobium sp. FGCU52]